ncbi:MAG: glycerol kinase [Salinicola sp.]|uniref:FGGY family carbohydrate kinase n=1 Tax=Salinicola sp. TaxID=1978524 RepID=UPI001DBC8782|nr:FGGY family carbohydrate kinase [Salinicola sp.]NRB58157.1 glycerol kinase [Salinicola sp.]
MATSAILAIDQGTTNSKALLLDMAGRPIARGQCAIECHYPRSGWVEQSGEALFQSVLNAINHCLDGHDDVAILALGISSQRESAMAWSARGGRPLGPCISWQCRRSQPQCDALEKAGASSRVRELSGLPLDPLFSAAKFRWLLEHVGDECAAADIRLGTVDSWLLWKLTGHRLHLTDLSNASRTQLCDIHRGRWSAELTELFGVPSRYLPEIRHSADDFGTTASGLGKLPAGIPILSIVGDSHAALLAQGGQDSRIVKATYGTGSSVMTTTGDQPVEGRGLATTVAWETDQGRVYALEGNVTVSAAVLPWVARLLGLEGSVKRLGELARAADPQGSEILVPAMVGLGAPRWVGGLSALMDGLPFRTGPAEIALAAFDSIVFQIRDVVDAMQAAGRTRDLPPLSALKADGGASCNDWLMQRQAEALDLHVQRARFAELSALGAALLAGHQHGCWRAPDAFAAVLPEHDDFAPRDAAAFKPRHDQWLRAVARTLHGTPAAVEEVS